MHIVILVTASSRKEALRIAEGLIQKKLAACVNIIDKLESVFWWQNKVDRAKEVLLIIKSTKKNLPKIVRAIRSCHSYEVPEIIALPIIGGFKRYLDWIHDSIR